MIERTLVIGSTGFIGRAVAGHLNEQGWNVIGMRRWDSPVDLLENLGIPDIVADLEDRDALLHAMSGVNYLVYCAAPDADLPADEYRRRATIDIRNVLQVARDADVERVLVTSTAATVAADGESEADESEDYLPGTAEDHFVEAAYGVEQECYRQSADGQDIVTVNPSIVVGPGAHFPARSRLDGVGEERPVNWVGLDRVARAHRLALEHGRRGERYIVGGANGRLGDFYETVRQTDDVTIEAGGMLGGPKPYRNRYLLTGGGWLDSRKAEQKLGL